MEFSAWTELVYLISKVDSRRWKSLTGQEKFSCKQLIDFSTSFHQKLLFPVFLSKSFWSNDNNVSFGPVNVSSNMFRL